MNKYISIIVTPSVLSAVAFVVANMLSANPEPVAVTETTSSTAMPIPPNLVLPSPAFEAPPAVTVKETVIAVPKQSKSDRHESEKESALRFNTQAQWTCTGWTESQVGGAYRTCEWK